MEFAPAIVAKVRERSARFGELTEQLSDQEVASDGRRIARIARERGMLERASELCARMEQLLTRRAEALELLEDGDRELAQMAREELAALEELETQLDLELKEELVTDDDLRRDKVIVEIRAGTGGDEATLFVRDLFEMYRRYCEGRRWKIDVIEVGLSEVGGMREMVFSLQGDEAWRLFRFESGGHRVQRVPATESQGRIHTSAATVAVLPEAEEVDVELKNEELRFDTMRAGGAGGQHVNKVETAVRVTHLPTGLAVVCQDSKSQRRNKEQALRLLRTKLFERERSRVEAERSAERRDQVGSGDRSQRVRTYNYPQNRVSDHRLGENFSLEHVVAGKLDPILTALDHRDREERIKNL